MEFLFFLMLNLVTSVSNCAPTKYVSLLMSCFVLKDEHAWVEEHLKSNLRVRWA